MKMLLLALLASPLAQASSLNCQDLSGQRLMYSFSTPDGGAALGPKEKLRINGETLIQIDPHNPSEDVRKALFSVDENSGKIILKTETDDKKFNLIAFVGKAKVREIAGDEELQPLVFESLVLCERKLYKGPPNIP